MYARHMRILQEITYDNPNVLVLQRCKSTSTLHDVNIADSTESMGNDAKREIRCSFPANNVHTYPDILSGGVFCLVARGARLVLVNLLDALAANCIPVIMADNIVMPFNEVLV